MAKLKLQLEVEIEAWTEACAGCEAPMPVEPTCLQLEGIGGWSGDRGEKGERWIAHGRRYPASWVAVEACQAGKLTPASAVVRSEPVPFDEAHTPGTWSWPPRQP